MTQVSKNSRASKACPECGDCVTMLFHGFGAVSEEDYEVRALNEDGSVTLDTDESEIEKCFRFDLTTGKCLNDNNAMGCYRTLKRAW